jgi:hypothetical protein
MTPAPSATAGSISIPAKRLLAGSTAVVSVSELFPMVGSAVVEETEAVWDRLGFRTVGRTAMDLSTVAPWVTIPRLQVTVPDA